MSRPASDGVVRVEPTGDEAALRAAVDAALTGGAHRVEVLVPAGDPATVRTAARAGMRREGLLRGVAGPSPAGDRVLLARLPGDAAPGTREGFSAVLDTTMPVKRVIAQGLLRDRDGRVLLCETTYKRDWDLPGGIVDPDEAPSDTVAREVREELGVDLRVGRLLVLSWLPRYLGWSDAVQCVYDLGTHDADVVDTLTIAAGEIRAVHWAAAPERCAPYERTVIEAACSVGPGDPVVELRAGERR